MPSSRKRKLVWVAFAWYSLMVMLAVWRLVTGWGRTNPLSVPFWIASAVNFCALVFLGGWLVADHGE